MGWHAFSVTDPIKFLDCLCGHKKIPFDRHHPGERPVQFKGRLAEISAPTLVIAGSDDPFYSEALFRETAVRIPNARVILYPKKRHPAYGKQVKRDVLAFLKEIER